MLRPNIEYLKFDDRKFTILGILVLSLFVPILFFGLSFQDYFGVFCQQFLESFVYTSVYWLGLRAVLIYLRKKYKNPDENRKRLMELCILVLISVPVIGFLVAVFNGSIYYLMGVADIYQPTYFQAKSSTYFSCFAILGFYEAIYFFHKYKEAIVEKEQIEKEHIQTQLENLRNQINPHFLFNSLNTLMHLIPTDPDRAMNYLTQLSKFYRYAVSEHDEKLVSLNKELVNLEIFVKLLRERFHDGIVIELPSSIPQIAQIPPLCLQLLIENAVKHNIVNRKKPLKIIVSLTDNEQYVTVKNNIQRKIQEVSSTGKGLKNIEERIAYFSTNPLKVIDDGVSFSVSIPLVFR